MLEAQSLNMYITLTGIQNGEQISLAKALSTGTPADQLVVALYKLTYYIATSGIASAPP